MTIADKVSALVNKAGFSVTYKRRTSAGTFDTSTLQKTPTYSTQTVFISCRFYTLKEIGSGLVDAGDREVRIAASDLSFTPSRGDILVISGHNYKVLGVDTRSAKNESCLHILRVGGDNG